MEIIQQVNHWIDNLLEETKTQQISCTTLKEKIGGYYSDEFLARAGFVITENIPKPNVGHDLPGAESFFTLNACAITYKNTYFVLPDIPLSTHVHELVHVCQWEILGAEQFILAYIHGVQTQGYRESPLEVMAYDIQYEFEERYSKGEAPFDIYRRVRSLLKNNV